MRSGVGIALGLVLCLTGSAAAASPISELDGIAAAVDGAESSHGTDPAMWRADPAGPQGPMQVSAAAAADVGGGNRFDIEQNRALGRAYLAQMYRRFGSWADAVVAYNWGPARLGSWIADGRPPQGLPYAVTRYQTRVLFGSTLAAMPEGVDRATTGFGSHRLGLVHPQPRAAAGRMPLGDAVAINSLYAEIMRASRSDTR